MKSKLRADTTGFVRISNRAIKLAKKNKRKTGVPIGKFIEDAIYAFDSLYTNFNHTQMRKDDVIAPLQKVNIKYIP